jgi:uncharacterized protein (TIGR02722 family)
MKRMMKRFLLLAPTLLLGACAGLYQSQASTPEGFKDILKLDDPSLNTEISLQSVKQHQVGDLLAVQVTVHNDTYLSHKYRYRLQWLDDNGFEVNAEGKGWLPVTLEGNQAYTIEGTAPSATAHKFRLEFGDQPGAPGPGGTSLCRIIDLIRRVQMKRSALALSLLALAMGGLTACTTVKYGDAQAVETTNTDFGSTDLHLIATKMVDSLLASGFTVQNTANGKRPVVYVNTVTNKTDEHIDTESVTDSISTELLKSGLYRFVDPTQVSNVRAQLNFQNNDALANPATAIHFGQMTGAQYMLYGNLAGIDKRNGNNQDVYYKFTLRLLNLQSGLIEWMDEKEIRKTSKTGLFGM